MTSSHDPLLALVADTNVNLSPLTERLWANKIPHRVVVQDGKQCLLLARENDLPQMKTWLEEWQNNQLDQSDLIPDSADGSAMMKGLLNIAEAPLATLCIPLFVMMFAWMHISTDWNQWLLLGESLWPQQRFALSAYTDMGFWELWRPTLLHFSVLHILMNMFWWWLLARRIERIDGKLALISMILICGVLGNAAQWWYAGPGFGGASGVTLGMLAWVASRQRRLRLPYQLPPALLPIMVGWLLLTLMGDTIVPGLSGTAHGAHFGGLLAGLLCAFIWPANSALQSNT